MAQALLAAGKERGFIAGLDDDDAIGIEASLSKRRREKIGTCDAPQHLAACARSDTRGEEDRGGAV